MLTTLWFALELILILKSESRMRGELNGFFIIYYPYTSFVL